MAKFFLTKEDIKEAWNPPPGETKIRLIQPHAWPPYQTHFIGKRCRGCVRERISVHDGEVLLPLETDQHADWCLIPLARAAEKASNGG